MSLENSTTPAPAATLTEKELWALFVTKPLHVSLGAGVVIDRYRPDDVIRDPGCYGCMSEFSRDLGDGLLEVDEPEDELRQRVEEAEAYIAGLKSVLEDFGSVKRACLIPDDSEEYLYSMPPSPDSEAV